MRYVVNQCKRASYNIAMDEWMLTHLKPREPVFSLWQNENAVIIGKHQNTFEEVNEEYVKQQNIEVIRRVSGGGAVYHDRGNVNFTFIIPIDSPKHVDWKVFVDPMLRALKKFRLPVALSGRNDIELDGKKISGNAQRFSNGYLMHHGTLMFDVDIETMIRSLQVSDEKFISKAVKSVRSRVGNIQEWLPEMSVEEFIEVLRNELSNHGDDKEIVLSKEQLAEINRLEEEKFSTWEWNYGESPPFNYHAHEKFDGGILDVKANVKDGIIQSIHFEGDFLGIEDVEDIEEDFVGMPFAEESILELLKKHEEKQYFGSIETSEVVSLFHKEKQ